VTLQYQGPFRSSFGPPTTAELDFRSGPHENTIEGAVRSTWIAFAGASKALRVQSELSLPIRHFSSRERVLTIVTEVRSSNPQALAQCRVWLRTNFPVRSWRRRKHSGAAHR
jgi:prephenate dehydratase